MRSWIALAALAAALSIGAPARAQEWCGFQDKTGAVIKCGYSSLAQCRQQAGTKDTVCMPDPDFASRAKHGKTKVASN